MGDSPSYLGNSPSYIEHSPFSILNSPSSIRDSPSSIRDSISSIGDSHSFFYLGLSFFYQRPCFFYWRLFFFFQDIRDCSLFPFVLWSSRLKGNFKETHNCTPYAKCGVASLKVPLRGIFHSSPVLTAGRVKNQYRCAWLLYPSGVKLFLSAARGLRWSLFYSILHSTGYSPVR